MVETQFNKKIKILRSDNGGEYISHAFSSFLDQLGILHQTTCLGTPEQNGVAERENRHLLEVARALLFTMNVPKTFWLDAVQTAAFLINRMPSRVLNFQSPLEVLSSPASLFPIPPKVFECICYVHVDKSRQSKLDPKALKCIFLGYGPSQKGYKCYHPVSRQRFVSMDVTFHEILPFFYSPSSSQREHSSVESSPLLLVPALSLTQVFMVKERRFFKFIPKRRNQAFRLFLLFPAKMSLRLKLLIHVILLLFMTLIFL